LTAEIAFNMNPRGAKTRVRHSGPQLSHPAHYTRPIKIFQAFCHLLIKNLLFAHKRALARELDFFGEKGYNRL